MSAEQSGSGIKRRNFLRLSAAAAAVPVVVGLGSDRAAADPPEPGPCGYPYTPPAGAIIASSYGFDPTDSTSHLQSALQAALAATHGSGSMVYLVIDRQASDWITGPLTIGGAAPYLKGPVPLTIIFEPGVTVTAKPGAFNGGVPCLITLEGPNNVTGGAPGVSGVTLSGYGATLSMNKQEYTEGEWRHILSVLSCDSITIEGLTLTGAGGDGIYLGQQPNDVASQNYCSNVTITNVHCDRNRRNGMSVAAVDGLTVTNCAFSGSLGTPPMAGIDFEPDPYIAPGTNGGPGRPYGRLQSITVSNCTFYDNVGYAVSVQATCLGGAPAANGPIGIALDNVRMGPTASAVATFFCSSSGDSGSVDDGQGPPLPGTVTVTDSLIDARVFATGILTEAMPSTDGIQLAFTRMVLWNLTYSESESVIWHGAVSKWAPITLLGNNFSGEPAANFGNVSWTDCVINTVQPNPLVVAPPIAGTTCSGLSGNITAYVPVVNNATALSLGSGATDITLAVNEILSPIVTSSPTPVTTVSVAASASAVTHPARVTLTFTRSSTDLSQTLAVVYSMSGTATERYDYDGLSGVVVFAPTEATATATLATRRADNGTDTRTATLQIALSDAYTVSPTAGSVSIAIS